MIHLHRIVISYRWLAASSGMVCLATAVVITVVYSHTFQVAGTFVSRVRTNDKVVALTFDDGPTDEAVASILTDLQRYQVPATFYVIGKEIQRNPAALRRLVTSGQEIGNHSYSHLSLAFVGEPRVDYELGATEGLIRDSGYAGPLTFRAPYGHKLTSLPTYLRHHGIVSISRDVAPDENLPDIASAETIATRALSQTRPGSIILLHAMYPINFKSRQAIPLIIVGLQAKGYRFVTISELLRHAEL